MGDFNSFFQRFKIDFERKKWWFTLFSGDIEGTGYNVPESKIQADNLDIARRRESRNKGMDNKEGGNKNA